MNWSEPVRPDYHLSMTHLSRRELGALLAALATQAPRLSGATGGTGQIDETLRNGIAQRKIPAAVGMAASADKILYSGAFGTRDSSGVPVAADSIFSIASMTKAITTTAALQLVEQGKVKLDEPVSKHLPKLANLQVLDGFDTAGKPRLRPAKTAVTLKHLLTHTSGICYDTWDADMFRYTKYVGTPPPAVPPLMFEPGTRWQYGMGVDWAGRLVEAISGVSLEQYFQTHVCGPLEMHDTSYLLPASKFDRLVTGYERQPDGTLKQNPRTPPSAPKEFNGGGGLYSTTGDYTRFMQMILHKGRGVNGARILQSKTVESMEINQIGAATAGKMKTQRPEILERRGHPARFQRKVGPRLPDQHHSLSRRPLSRKPGLGRPVQYVLLDRSEALALRRADDAIPAFCGPGSNRPAGRFRACRLQRALASVAVPSRIGGSHARVTICLCCSSIRAGHLACRRAGKTVV